jgi:hypothetical protein
MSLAGYVACMGKAVVYKGFWWGSLTERDHLEDPGEEGEDNINMNLREVRTICLRTSAGGGHL